MKKAMICVVGCVSVLISVAVFILLFACLSSCTKVLDDKINPPYEVTSETIAVHPTVTENANQHQLNASVKMIPSNGKLYYFIYWPGMLGKRSKFYLNLCTIEDGTIKSLEEMSDFLGYDDRYVYFLHYSKNSRENAVLKAYDVHLGKTIELKNIPEDGLRRWIKDPDGTLRFFINSDNGTGYIIRDGMISESFENMPPYAEYEIGGKKYSTRGYRGREVYCDDVDISEQFGLADFRALVPYRDGLLLINDGYSNLLYYIQGNGTIISLFPEFPCMDSESSVNFYNNYIYLSYNRSKGYDESKIGLARFPNDTLVGTYRINMDDYSVEKISDNIYDGMFIFDESGIYACNADGDIHHLDFDGNLIRTIVD